MAPRFVFVIRHGEKPKESDSTLPPYGVDSAGNRNIHGLTPRGWQRAGALVGLFAQSDGRARPPLIQPDRLVAADYGSEEDTTTHRPYLTLIPLAERLGLPIEHGFTVGEEESLAASLVAADNTATLICWVHEKIPAMASWLPVTRTANSPTEWRDDRFDLIWCFERSEDQATYGCTAIGQHLLAGDSDP